MRACDYYLDHVHTHADVRSFMSSTLIHACGHSRVCPCMHLPRHTSTFSHSLIQPITVQAVDIHQPHIANQVLTVTPKGVLRLAVCHASATLEAL